MSGSEPESKLVPVFFDTAVVRVGADVVDVAEIDVDIVPAIISEDIEEAKRMMAAEGFERGDLVVMRDGALRRAEGQDPIIGVAADRGLINFGGVHASVARDFPHYGSIHMSMAFRPGAWGLPRARPGGPRFQFTERFPKEVEAKAWKLVEGEMTPDQYFAFMEGATIEMENLAGDFRLIINKSGKFTILEGARGAGIVAQTGNVRSYKYPLGDEVSAFIDWFKHRTKELIAQWGCGTYGIVREGERR